MRAVRYVSLNPCACTLCLASGGLAMVREAMRAHLAGVNDELVQTVRPVLDRVTCF